MTAGISVVMDVVYNHTYVTEGSCFTDTVPNYYYRINKFDAFILKRFGLRQRNCIR